MACVPQHVRTLGDAAAGCEHLAQEDDASSERLLELYAAGLRWGRRLLDGKIRPQDGADDALAPGDKRRKVRPHTDRSLSTQHVHCVEWICAGHFCACRVRMLHASSAIRCGRRRCRSRAVRPVPRTARRWGRHTLACISPRRPTRTVRVWC